MCLGFGFECTQPVHAGTPPAVPVSNFEEVSPVLWRGAAPSSAALKVLAKNGVKTIIDLRLDPEKTRKEARLASDLGMRYVHIPLGYLSPSNESVCKFF